MGTYFTRVYRVYIHVLYVVHRWYYIWVSRSTEGKAAGSGPAEAREGRSLLVHNRHCGTATEIILIEFFPRIFEVAKQSALWRNTSTEQTGSSSISIRSTALLNMINLFWKNFTPIGFYIVSILLAIRHFGKFPHVPDDWRGKNNEKRYPLEHLNPQKTQEMSVLN